METEPTNSIRYVFHDHPQDAPPRTTRNPEEPGPLQSPGLVRRPTQHSRHHWLRLINHAIPAKKSLHHFQGPCSGGLSGRPPERKKMHRSCHDSVSAGTCHVLKSGGLPPPPPPPAYPYSIYTVTQKGGKMRASSQHLRTHSASQIAGDFQSTACPNPSAPLSLWQASPVRRQTDGALCVRLGSSQRLNGN